MAAGLLVALICGCGTPGEDGAATSSPPGTDDDEETPAPAEGLRVFVTSEAFRGNLRDAGGGADGLAGADALCAQAAEAAGLGGRWVAWLSTSSTHARERITSVGPWYLTDGTTRVFDSVEDLSAGPLTAISRDEHGREVLNENVWTGTAADGTAAPYTENCMDWTETVDPGDAAVHPLPGWVGSTGSAAEAWTDVTELACANNSLHLYCFEL